MNNAMQLIVRADHLLSTIPVKGDDVYTLVEARRLLTAAYNELKNELRKENGNANPDLDGVRNPGSGE